MMEWKLYVRDNHYLIQGEIDDYESATLVPVFRDVGTWTLTIDARSHVAALLMNPDWGIVATRNDVPLFSGIWAEIRLTRDDDHWNLEFQGVTDEIWLVDRLVSPSPADTGPPYSAQASDIRTGLASTVIRAYVDVNVGQGAVASRRRPNFTVAGDPAIGASVRGEGRWDADVLAFIQPLATTGGVGFRVVQLGAALQFQVYAPGDKSGSVKYSIGLGNLEAYEFTRSRPKGNYVFVGASGTGTSRIIKEFSDGAAMATWGRIEGPLANASSTSDTSVIAQTGADALAQNSEQASMSFTPVETDDMKYGVHYAVGDKIAAQLENPIPTPYGIGGQIVDVVRQAEIRLQKDGPQTVTPSFGTPSRGDTTRLVAAFQKANQRLNNLERS